MSDDVLSFKRPNDDLYFYITSAHLFGINALLHNVIQELRLPQNKAIRVKR